LLATKKDSFAIIHQKEKESFIFVAMAVGI